MLHIPAVTCQSHRLLAFDTFLLGFPVALIFIQNEYKAFPSNAHHSMFVEDFPEVDLNGILYEMVTKGYINSRL